MQINPHDFTDTTVRKTQKLALLIDVVRTIRVLRRVDCVPLKSCFNYVSLDSSTTHEERMPYGPITLGKVSRANTALVIIN